MSPVAAPVGTASVLYLTESTTTTTTAAVIPTTSPVVQWEDPPSVSLVRNADEQEADSLSVLWLDDRSCVPIREFCVASNGIERHRMASHHGACKAGLEEAKPRHETKQNKTKRNETKRN
mmetsp:Transcript_23979/g.66448  ORF Transcript_23979/g.66448 Transcript_23979/m.66448 type:complete len:120 (-) Transcript_23979:120-479(-)